MTRPSLRRGRGPAAVPPSATTTSPEPELAARAGIVSNVEEDMTEFLGTDGGQIADEVTRLTAAAEQVVAARPELVGPGGRHHPGRRGEARMHSGRPAPGPPPGPAPRQRHRGQTGP